MEVAVSAVIVNYNAGRFLKGCVDSLLACPLIIEVIVVDNGSSDGSLDTLDIDDNLKVITNGQNLGFSAGCNVGLKAASSRFFFFVNPDCSFLPGTVERLLGYLQSNERIGMVGGLLVNPDGTEQRGGRRTMPTPWSTFVRVIGLTRFSGISPKSFEDFHLHKQPLPKNPIEVEAISGACMLVKREAHEDVGLWDEGYFLHCEDLDYCMRFNKKGWGIGFVPDARIVHERGACSRTQPIFVEWHKHKGMMRFYWKFFWLQYPRVLIVFFAFGVWMHFGLVAAYHIAKRVAKSVFSNMR